jgi:hypothetical protein
MVHVLQITFENAVALAMVSLRRFRKICFVIRNAMLIKKKSLGCKRVAGRRFIIIFPIVGTKRR